MRKNEGRETISELTNWDRGQAASERLAGKILLSEGFEDVDPSHPTGGPDGGKDFLCSFNGNCWVAAVYFPRGDKNFKDIKAKFAHDLEGVRKNGAVGFAFITNQEITISQRKELEDIAGDVDLRIYHLERIANILDNPKMYGVRLEFLDIEMTKEEQLSYINSVQEKQFRTIEHKIEEIKSCLIFERNVFYDDRDDVRSLQEIEDAEQIFYEKVWLDRHFSLAHRIQELSDSIPPDIWEKAQSRAQELIRKYGEDNVGPYSDFEWGMLNGKLSALRWVLGYEWDMLDT